MTTPTLTALSGNILQFPSSPCRVPAPSAYAGAAGSSGGIFRPSLGLGPITSGSSWGFSFGEASDGFESLLSAFVDEGTSGNIIGDVTATGTLSSVAGAQHQLDETPTTGVASSQAVDAGGVFVLNFGLVLQPETALVDNDDVETHGGAEAAQTLLLGAQREQQSDSGAGAVTTAECHHDHADLHDNFRAPPTRRPTTKTRRRDKTKAVGFCAIRSCVPIGGFETNNAEGGCRSFHKHFLRDLRELVEPPLRASVFSPQCAIPLQSACWLAVAACLLGKGAAWRTVAREDSQERCDPYRFCTKSYAWVRRTDLGAKLFVRTASGERPTGEALLEFPRASQVLASVCDASKRELQSLLQPIVEAIERLPTAHSARARVPGSGLTRVAGRDGAGRKEIVHVALDGEAIARALSSAIAGTNASAKAKGGGLANSEESAVTRKRSRAREPHDEKPLEFSSALKRPREQQEHWNTSQPEPPAPLATGVAPDEEVWSDLGLPGASDDLAVSGEPEQTDLEYDQLVAELHLIQDELRHPIATTARLPHLYE